MQNQSKKTFIDNVFGYIDWGKEGSEWTSCAFSNDPLFPNEFETFPSAHQHFGNEN